MSKILFLDVEATGVNQEDRLLQVAYKFGNVTRNELFKPPVTIQTAAKAIHHITEDDVHDKAPFIGSSICQELKDLNDDGYILVAHNAPYDLAMLEKEGVTFDRIIDTLKIARHIDDGDMEMHTLQYLRYYYDLKIDLGDLNPHDALADIIVLEHVFKQLAEGFTVEKLEDITKKPSLLKKITFGKHRGKTVQQVCREDRGYLEWLLSAKLAKPEGEENWIYTLETVLHS